MTGAKRVTGSKEGKGKQEGIRARVSYTRF